ncbi:MAG: NAD-binding protein [Promethearchaeia archaeon]
MEELKDKRTLIVDSNEKALEFAIELTDYTNRVIVTTNRDEIPGSEEMRKKLKFSDVKILRQSELIEIQGTDSVEKVLIHDLDEDENYELFVDSVIILK